MALHDVNLASRYCSHCLLIFKDGHVQSGACDELLNKTTLQDLYEVEIDQAKSDYGMIFIPK
jgi:iron complex transport system ATP-binding protein